MVKRKDFLRRMRDRRRGDREIERRAPEQRRATDWRTLRVELPAAGEDAQQQPLAVGSAQLHHGGLRLAPTTHCWVRGYRRWIDDDGIARAELQYRPVDEDTPPPPGANAVAPGETWDPD